MRELHAFAELLLSVYAGIRRKKIMALAVLKIFLKSV